MSTKIKRQAVFLPRRQLLRCALAGAGACLLPACGGGNPGGTFSVSLGLDQATSPLIGDVNITALPSNASGAVNYTFTIDGENFGAPGAATNTRAWYTELMENGDHTLHVRATDAAGHIAEAERSIATANTPATEPEIGLPAFPGAEGFGAIASGGRGGRVIYVTNLNSNGPGSFNNALGQQGPRYILFKVSGEITIGGGWDDVAHIEYGDVTVAGQTSPGGIIVHGFRCDNDHGHSRDNVIMRHLRTRPNGEGLDDGLRIAQCKNIMLDHLSVGRAGDECIQVPNVKNYTIQNSIFTETVGEHWDRGGMLIKYASKEFPNDRISVHHNLFTRLGGRTPQIDIDDDRDNTWAFHNKLHLEVSNNLYWDVGYPMYYSGQWLVDDTVNHYTYHLNLVNNLFHVKSSYPFGMFMPAWVGDHQLYLSGNQMNLYTDRWDYQLFSPYNHYNDDGPSDPSNFRMVGAGTHLSQPHAYAPITYHAGSELPDYAVKNVGAFPRDPMDSRLLHYVQNRSFDPSNVWGCAKDPVSGALSATDSSSAANTGAGINPVAQTVTDLKTGNRLNLAAGQLVDDALYVYWTTPPIAPLDSDGDGMPDDWEIANGLNPNSTYADGTAESAKEHNQTNLSVRYTGVSGYTNLECYLNRLAEHLVDPSIPLIAP